MLTLPTMNHTLRPIQSMAFLAALAGLTACSPPKKAVLPPPKVTVVQPVMGSVTNWDEYPGHLEAMESVEIRPRVSGYIDSIHFQDGAEVKAGDLLFVIDPKPYLADLDRAQAQRQQAETRLALASNDLQRAESLRGTKAISLEELDGRSKATREAEGGLAAARAAEATARLNLDYTQIKAPINGRIGRRLITVGNLVQAPGGAGTTALATLVSLDPVYCSFDVEEGLFRNYRSNAEAAAGLAGKPGGLPCELALVNEEGFPHAGRIDFFDNQVNPRTGTIRMRGVWANPGRALVPGMFARVRVPAGPPAPACLVPAVAISTDQSRKLVMVVNHESVIEPRPVRVGRQHGSLTAVLEGLKPEDRVVVNGLMMARPGTKVEVVEAPTKVGSPAPGAPR
jgi:RND family efflux transporter MFP subunit